MDWLVMGWQYVRTLPHNNFGKVSDSIYRSAQPSLKQLREYKQKYEITLIINLRDKLDGNEENDAKACEMDFWHVPMEDDAEPDPSKIGFALELMREPSIKLIQCKGGRHRTGLMVAVYRVVVDHYTKERAWAEAKRYGWYDAGGKKVLREWFEHRFDPEVYRLAKNHG